MIQFCVASALQSEFQPIAIANSDEQPVAEGCLSQGTAKVAHDSTDVNLQAKDADS